MKLVFFIALLAGCDFIRNSEDYVPYSVVSEKNVEIAILKAKVDRLEWEISSLQSTIELYRK